uniref:Uncharacterized protein n=1 Tax=Ursus maritimus TaxID=29073 RepID=A0A452UM14_URSMA
MHHIFFMHSLADGHLGSFHNLAIVDNAAVNIGVHVPLRISIFVSFGWRGVGRGWDTWAMGIKEGSGRDEHWVLYVSHESLNSPETNITLYVN